MLNLSNLTHSILTEESDNWNSNNNSLFFHDFFIHHDPIVENNSYHHAVYDTALFDVLKVDPEDFAVSEYSLFIDQYISILVTNYSDGFADISIDNTGGMMIDR